MEEKNGAKISISPCYKKKEGAEGGMLADMRDHLDQFKNSSAEKHWICLKKSTKRAGNYIRHKKENISLFGSRKVGMDGNEGVKNLQVNEAAEA